MADTAVASTEQPALKGLKVVELAQLIAGPMAGSFLADFGADVVHVEDPDRGDPGRYLGIAKDGVHLWWKVSGRNKRCVTLDLRKPEGQEIARRLAQWADVLISNFRVETLERWGLDWESLHRENPKLILLQVSGFGTNTTRRNRPGFGKVGEAMSGVVQLTGFPDGPPIHAGFSHADSLTGLFGAFAIQTALYRRANNSNFDGEWIDLALFEALYRLCEWQVIFYDQTGVAPMRAGNQLANSPAAVVNTYKSRDGHWITVTSGTTRSVQKVAALLGEPHENYATAELQSAHRQHIDQLLRDYIAERAADDVLIEMDGSEITASVIYSMKEIAEDKTYREREDIITIDDPDLGPVRMQAVLPKLAHHGGRVWRTGPKLGQDNELVYKGYLGMNDGEFSSLQENKII